MKNRNRYIVAIIISIGIFIFVLGSIIFINHWKLDNKYLAKEGVMDLRTWDSYDSDIIGLVGEWGFFLMNLINIKKTENM